MNHDNMPKYDVFSTDRTAKVTARIRKLIAPHTDKVSVYQGVEEIITELEALRQRDARLSQIMIAVGLDGDSGPSELIEKLNTLYEDAQSQTAELEALRAQVEELQSDLAGIYAVSAPVSTAASVSMDMLHISATENKRLRDGIDLIYRHSIRGWNGDDFAKVQAFARMAQIAEAMNAQPFEDVSESEHAPADLEPDGLAVMSARGKPCPVCAKAMDYCTHPITKQISWMCTAHGSESRYRAEAAAPTPSETD